MLWKINVLQSVTLVLIGQCLKTRVFISIKETTQYLLEKKVPGMWEERVVMEYGIQVYFGAMVKNKMWKLSNRQSCILFILAQIPRNNWEVKNKVCLCEKAHRLMKEETTTPNEQDQTNGKDNRHDLLVPLRQHLDQCLECCYKSTKQINISLKWQAG